MTWEPVNFAAGVWKDDSPLKAMGRYINADKVRFVNGLPETIYGWERASTSTLLGLCRGAFTWADNSRNAFSAFGTHLRLYAMDIDGNVTDITPVVSYGQSSISFTTTNASAVVTITGWTHGLVADQKFKLENSTVAAVGGVTINGTYTVLTVESATSITFTAAQTATSAAGPTAAQVDITIYLAPGQSDGLGGLGFGTGGYGSGGYGGGSSSYALYPRTWSFDQWGQNLLASPRGGSLYEWGPNVTASELLTNGDFTTSSGWTAGAGWSVGGSAAFATAGAASDLQQTVTTQPGAWHVLGVNITVAAGTLQEYLGTSTIGSGAISATGNYRRAVLAAGTSAVLKFSKDATFNGTLRGASFQVLTTAELVPNAPTQIGSMFVAAERSVVACGSNLDGMFDPLQVDWSDQENNQLWAAASTNFAGGFTLSSGSRVVRGLPGTRENVLWTDLGLWAMRYNGDPNSVYDFIEMGEGCGLIGPNAAALVGGVWHWMTPSGAFFAYGGGAPQMLACTLARDVKDNLAWVQQDKVYASAIVGKNYAEVWWFYPDSRDGSECSRYVVYDTIKGTWSCGIFDRSAYVDRTVFEYPLAVDTSGTIWFQEKGFTADGGARSYSVTGAYNTNFTGSIIINGVRPDADDLQGGYDITFTSINRNVTGIFSRTYPGLSINSATGQRSIRVKGEQVGFTISGTSSPAFWRLGQTEIDIIASRSTG